MLAYIKAYTYLSYVYNKQYFNVYEWILYFFLVSPSEE